MSSPIHEAVRPNDGLYYYAGSARVPLYVDPKVVVLRQPTAHADPMLARALPPVPEGLEPLAYLPRDGMHVLRVPERNEKLADALKAHTDFAPGYQRAASSADSVLLTSRILVRFKPELTAQDLAKVLEQHGLSVLESLAYAAPNGFLLHCERDVDGLLALQTANELVESGLVEFAEPDLVQLRHPRDGAIDPARAEHFAQQWHLQVVGAAAAWRVTRGSADVRIAILDDGLDTAHVEFAPLADGSLVKVAAAYDFASDSDDVTPRSSADRHGTACAGVAAAAGIGAAGIAPQCRLVVARMPNYLGASDEARTFQWAADVGADVISCSWGPVDGTGLSFPLPSTTRAAIRYCLERGRGGRGIPIFWAAGNGSELADADGYAANPDVMAIAACTAAELPALYSDYGSVVFACAPSSGGPQEPRVFTTDLSGAPGYNHGLLPAGDSAGNYTNAFGGTSAAAPLAAGIAALVLSVNPLLRFDQVRELLARTAEQIGDPNTYGPNGRSERTGYGRLHAGKAVAAALSTSADAETTPRIVGPRVWSRANGPPTFQISPLPNRYYIVEVATDPRLFDCPDQDCGRSADNFYGSWSEVPFLTEPSYVLPSHAWQRLRVAAALFYRVGTSSSAEHYTNYATSTRDQDAAQAPSLAIVSGIAAAAASTTGAERKTLSELVRRVEGVTCSVQGPVLWRAELGPPSFRVEPLDATCWLELAAEPAVFEADSERHPELIRELLQPTRTVALQPRRKVRTHTLSARVWSKLQTASVIFYRLRIDPEQASAVREMRMPGASEG